MTAANIFARRNAAWLFADTAAYDDDGFVLRFASKIATNGDLRIAVSLCGRFADDYAAAYLQQWLDVQRSQADALEGLPSQLRAMVAEAARTKPRSRSLLRRLITGRWRAPTARHGGRFHVVWWDAEADAGEAAVIASDDEFAPYAAPFELYPVRNLCSPSPVEGKYFDYDYDFDPACDAQRLAELQRMELDDDGLCKVGGALEAVRVHAAGIDREEVTRWPDRIGYPITSAWR